MATVTYRKQPAIHKTRGSVPLAGTSHVYTVSDVLWPGAVEGWIKSKFIGSVLHVCCGKSKLGDVRVDLHEESADYHWDAAKLECEDLAFDTYLCDPPYNGKFAFMHEVLNEAIRVTRKRIIWQAWWIPVSKDGFLKKAHAFELREVALVPSLRGHEHEIRPAVFDPESESWMIVEDDEMSDEKFKVIETAVWQPRSYFGRVQAISIFERVGQPTGPQWTQLELPFHATAAKAQ